MKKATTFLYDDLENKQLIHGKDWGFCAFVHDEWQLLVKEDLTDCVATAAVNSIEQAGDYFELKCPFTGEYRIGKNWQETH